MNKETLEFNTIEKVCLKSGAVSLEANEYMTSFSFIVQDENRRISLGDIERHMIGHKIEQQLFDLILSLDVQCSITQKECNIMGEGFYVGKGKDRFERKPDDYDKLANKGLIDYTLVESMKK